MHWSKNNLESKWLKHYLSLTRNAQHRGKPSAYTEEHHIWPTALGGQDTAENIAVLTAREHLIAHKMLVRFCKGQAKRKMQHALWAMASMKSYSTAGRIKVSSRDFENARKHLVEAKKGVTPSLETKKKISESLKKYNAENGSPNKGRSFDHLSVEERVKLFGSKNLGRIQTQEEKDKRAAKNRGKTRSPEIKEKMRIAAIRREETKRLKRLEPR